MTLKSVVARVALEPAAPVDVDSVDNKADSTGVVDVSHGMSSFVFIRKDGNGLN